MRMAGASTTLGAERAQARRQAAGLRPGARHGDADAGQRAAAEPRELVVQRGDRADDA